MGSWSIWHWLVVLLIVMVIFGTKKLRNIGSDLGGAVKGFKDGMKEGGSTEKPADTPAPTLAASEKTEAKSTIDVEAKIKS